MQMTFANPEIQKLCIDSRYSARKLGALSAKKLRLRLEEMATAHAATELFTGHPHPLEGDRTGEFSLRLHGGHRLIFKPSHETPPELEAGGIDWGMVAQVLIVEIGDYHDE